jgi:hypothetical protein
MTLPDFNTFDILRSYVESNYDTVYEIFNNAACQINRTKSENIDYITQLMTIILYIYK